MSESFHYTDWAKWKGICITRKNLTIQENDIGQKVVVIGPDANRINHVIYLSKKLEDGSDNPDYLDFVSNVLPNCDWPIGVKSNAFSTSDYEFMPSKIQDICPAGGSKSAYMKITENCRINGGKLITDGNAAFGDWAECSLVDHDNILGYGVDTILKLWLPSWGVDWKSCSEEILTNYAGTPPIGMYLKFTYHSVGSVNVGFAVNFLLHRPL